MTDWKKVQGSQSSRPAEFDSTSSPTTVYQRRNIKMVIEEKDGASLVHYEYEERTMSHEEYAKLKTDNMQSTIEYIAVMAGIDLEEVV